MSSAEPLPHPVAPPAAARALFGPALPAAVAYAEWLVGPGIERGLLGPAEAERIWERHLLNCVASAELIPRAAEVIDVGSGAGLPGIVLALARPDLSLTLLEPMQRRVTFLAECVADLRLPNVTVERARAQEAAPRLRADVVTARAVAPLAKLVAWCWPLVRAGGQLLALRGASARAELERERAALPASVVEASVQLTGAAHLDRPAIIVQLIRGGPR